MPRWPKKEEQKPIEKTIDKSVDKPKDLQEGTKEWFSMMAERNRQQMLKATRQVDVKAFQSLEEHYKKLAEQAK